MLKEFSVFGQFVRVSTSWNGIPMYLGISSLLLRAYTSIYDVVVYSLVHVVVYSLVHVVSFAVVVVPRSSILQMFDPNVSSCALNLSGTTY